MTASRKFNELAFLDLLSRDNSQSSLYRFWFVQCELVVDGRDGLSVISPILNVFQFWRVKIRKNILAKLLKIMADFNPTPISTQDLVDL